MFILSVIKIILKKTWAVILKVYVPLGLTLSMVGVASHTEMKGTLSSIIEDNYFSVIKDRIPATTMYSDTSAALFLSPQKNRFITIDDEVIVAVDIHAGVPVGAVEATLSFPAGDVEIASVSKQGSVISEWVQGPTFSNEVGIIKFAGIIHGGGFSGSGTVLTFMFKPQKIGEIQIGFSDGVMLTHGASDVSVLEEKVGVEYFVRRAHTPSPDLNFDNIVDSLDLEILSDHWGETRSLRFDLNQDGIVSLPDFNILSSLYRE